MIVLSERHGRQIKQAAYRNAVGMLSPQDLSQELLVNLTRAANSGRLDMSKPAGVYQRIQWRARDIRRREIRAMRTGSPGPGVDLDQIEAQRQRIQ